MIKTKSYRISKDSVVVAWERVKTNKGSYGIDEQSIRDFNKELKDNLYKIWNRMSSGTYFPTTVKAVVKLHLKPIAEPKFHEDSYGYRSGKSAVEAVGVARKRCWRQDWAIDLDIKGFFDNLDHDLVMKVEGSPIPYR